MPTVTRGDSSRPLPILDDIRFRAVQWNLADSAGGIVLSNHGYNAENFNGDRDGSTYYSIRATRALPMTGKFYVETWRLKNRTTLGAPNNPAESYPFFGFGPGTMPLIGLPLGSVSNSIGFGFSGGSVWVGAVNILGFPVFSYTIGARAGIAFDLGAGLWWLRLSPTGQWNASPSADPVNGVGGLPFVPSGHLFPMVSFRGNCGVVGANFGEDLFEGTPPSGFTGLFAANSFEAKEPAGYVAGFLEGFETYLAFGGSLAVSGGADQTNFQVANGNQLAAVVANLAAGSRTIDITATAPSWVKRSPLTKTFTLSGGVTAGIVLGQITQLQSSWPANTALGTTLATIAPSTWDDGRPFTGSLIFGPPNYNNGLQTAADGGTTGVFRLVTNNDKSGSILLNPNGPGLGSPVSQITDHVGVEALQ